MFIKVQAPQYDRYSTLIDEVFKLRKRVFADELGWNVKADGERERDAYDDLGPAYLIWTDPDQRVVYGSLRMMPTLGPTLLHDVFCSTFGENVDLMAASIWECTRLCVDGQTIMRDHADLTPMDGMLRMIAFAHEVALDAGISTLISNCEPHQTRLYRRAGADYEILGRADGFGARPVCCAAFHVTAGSLAKIRDTLDLERLQDHGPDHGPAAPMTLEPTFQLLGQYEQVAA